MAVYRALSISRRLKYLRTEHGLSQYDVAVELGISQAAYSRFERGSIDISLSRLFVLAELYNISVSKLLENL